LRLKLILLATSQVEAVALNPTAKHVPPAHSNEPSTPTAPAPSVPTSDITSLNAEWKHRDVFGKPGTGSGCDFAGTVVDVGEGVAEVKVGERVAGMVQGSNKPQHGAFAEYVKTDVRLIWKVPADFDMEEAAALGGVGIGESSHEMDIGAEVRLTPSCVQQTPLFSLLSFVTASPSLGSPSPT
jgi:hypothetical protein